MATYGKEKFRAKVVDLPCIIEAHKTYDNRQFYKISDICQVCIMGACFSMGGGRYGTNTDLDMVVDVGGGRTSAPKYGRCHHHTAI